MSVPHLDTRVINGRSWLLFGPFAGWSPKFLKQGKVTDLPLLGQAEQPRLDARCRAHRDEPGQVPDRPACCSARPTGSTHLREFAPSAVDSDWELDVAGQRVQVIRRKGAGGVLEFGTTVLAAADGSIAGLLGASPGASTAVPAMLDVMERCFADRYPGVAAQAQGDGAVARHRAVR